MGCPPCPQALAHLPSHQPSHRPGQHPPWPPPAPEATWRPSVSPQLPPCTAGLARPRGAPGPRLCHPTPPRQAQHMLGMEGQGRRGTPQGPWTAQGLGTRVSSHHPACLAAVGMRHQLRWGCPGHPVPGGPSLSLCLLPILFLVSGCVFIWPELLACLTPALPAAARGACTCCTHEHTDSHHHPTPGPARMQPVLNE